MSGPAFAALLLRLPAGAAAGLGLTRAAPLRAAGVSFDLEPIFGIRGRGGPGVAGSDAWEWHIARPRTAIDGAHAWALAHQAIEARAGLAAAPGVQLEPDLIQEWPVGSPDGQGGGLPGLAPPVFHDQLPGLPGVPGRFAWHLDDDFSQLADARQRVGVPSGQRIRIAHLDTGYDPQHGTLPAFIALQRNFVEGEPPDDARDRMERGLLKNPGHGTGTLSILAGRASSISAPGYPAFNAPIGGAPEAEVVPVRVAGSVVQIRTSGIAGGIAYVAGLCGNETTRVHVLSMSMGGVASHAWADAVNAAYDAGVVLVTAAGNNFSAGLFGVPTRFIVYPARFRRVIAACGVMADRRAYFGLAIGKMQGNWGPASKMGTAISAFTPNIAWAEIGAPAIVDMSGAGTSSATPQVAAAAALYVQMHRGTLLDRRRYPEPWMRVEAVRHALFSSADHNADGGNPKRIGNGVLQASRALDVSPVEAATLRKTPTDRATLAFLRAITGLGVQASARAEMLALEAAQLAQRWPKSDEPNPFEEAIPDPDLPGDAVAPEHTRRALEALLEHPEASPQLREYADAARRRLFGVPPPPAPKPPTRRAGKRARAGRAAPTAIDETPRRWTSERNVTVPAPPHRKLRAFALDPSLSTTLETAGFSEIVFNVPWEKLEPGPVGEYVEVIDIDPASDCFYDPVDLDDPRILAQDGLPPSEGTPQFHQQMVYAVASLTIRNFERALGRRVLWRPGPSPDPSKPWIDSTFVKRLRIYPHALRQQNAFYSPTKVALLFGYFNEVPQIPGDGRPGPMVFSCLSHDIVAHETTHALLDGMHRSFLRPSNPDVLAFHEAFADIVALFQHFTFPELLREQIGSTRGEIRTQESFLGQLARQFGLASGLRSALRSAIGEVKDGRWEPHAADPLDYQRLTEPHDLGGILVGAVFDAFLSIYERRTADLIRLGTDGTGVLRPGAIHPDLVTRLAREAAKSAQHVLSMCIRALDYMPPVDITFGEYLRAIITADTDVVPDDDLNYRIAFLEAFRRRGIQPRDVRTLSVESLLWRSADSDELQPSAALEEGLVRRLESFTQEYAFAESLGEGGQSRERLFHLQREARRRVHHWLAEYFATSSTGKRDAAFLGLDIGPDHPASFQVHSLRFATRGSPDGDVVPQIVLTLLQRVERPIDPADPDGDRMQFEGGCSIVADLRRLKIRYAIRKNLTSKTRLDRQQRFAIGRLDSLRSTYFRADPGEGESEPFARLHGGF